MRSKDLAKAAGLAVVFDLTAHTFYRVSPNVTSIQGRLPRFARPVKGLRLFPAYWETAVLIVSLVVM